jgi:ion channel-forming bestrophin family protein
LSKGYQRPPAGASRPYGFTREHARGGGGAVLGVLEHAATATTRSTHEPPHPGDAAGGHHRPRLRVFWYPAVVFVDYRGSLLRILGWQWKFFAFFTGAAIAVVVVDTYVPGLQGRARLPPLPVGVMGGAIGIFASFRTNSSYARWWEGRKLWGALVNASRHWVTQVTCYVAPGDEGADSLRKRLVDRHIGYVHTLRCLLRQQDPARDEAVRRYLTTDELAQIAGSSSATHLLLHQQMLDLQGAVRAGRLDRLHQHLMDATVRSLLDVQGGCERIKKTPFPRSYGFIADRLILAFSVLFPLALIGDVGPWAVPLSVLVCAGFLLISEVGRMLEDPFTMFMPALPLSALSTTIEINLRERMGERDLPPLPRQDSRGLLM